MRSRTEWLPVHVHMVLYHTVHMYNFYQGRAFNISFSMLQSANWKELTVSSHSAHVVSLGRAIYCISEIFIITYSNFRWIKSQHEASTQPFTSLSKHLSFICQFLRTKFSPLLPRNQLSQHAKLIRFFCIIIYKDGSFTEDLTWMKCIFKRVTAIVNLKLSSPSNSCCHK